MTQLRAWPSLPGMAVHLSARCTRRIRPAARCKACAPLFQTERYAKGGVTAPTMQARSRYQVESGFVGLSGAPAATRPVSGTSARKGGISTAIDAGVNETVLLLQSGHGCGQLPQRTRKCGSRHLPLPGNVWGLRPPTDLANSGAPRVSSRSHIFVWPYPRTRRVTSAVGRARGGRQMVGRF